MLAISVASDLSPSHLQLKLKRQLRLLKHPPLAKPRRLVEYGERTVLQFLNSFIVNPLNLFYLSLKAIRLLLSGSHITL